jgi:Actinobacteria/chloroflexi VLRF1 release factor
MEHGPRTVLVPVQRLPRWLENFQTRHGETVLHGPPLTASAEDGATASFRGPFGTVVHQIPYEPPQVRWGLLLVRKGGFAIAAGTSINPSHRKIGRRHVQGRSKAGGWSQQRFARRRANQARDAFGAAADHAHRILVEEMGGLEALVCGGDHRAVDEVLDDPRLRSLRDVVVEPWLTVPDPNATILSAAVADAWSCRVEIFEPG